MTIVEKEVNETLSDYAIRLANLYSEFCEVGIRKTKGQIFTPKQISMFMANMVKTWPNTIRLMDPGAGTGVLAAAFCDHVLGSDKKTTLIIDAYENDPALLPLLDATLRVCKSELEKRGHSIEYNIYEQDFILYNAKYFRRPNELPCIEGPPILYDLVISNPPYYKLNKDSPQSKAMKELIYGQPNIYALFMALSASMLKDGGEMIFITPRSFCSGLYYKKFREWFLDNVRITEIHVFESRKDVFDNDEVLQENIIVKARKERITSDAKVTVSVSKDKSFRDLRRIEVPCTAIVYECEKEGSVFIRIPTSSLDLDVLRVIDAWPNTLRDLGLEISTGPVVPFRAREYLLPTYTGRSEAPLLWMHNLQGLGVIWPLRNTKDEAIAVSDATKQLLLPVQNYVLVKRFSSKEQKRRLYAGVLLESEFNHELVGIENHLNYIYRPDGVLSEEEAYGIAAILNTSFVDNYFRSLNGNTQVNATDIRSLPFPTIEEIRGIGSTVRRHPVGTGYRIDSIVADAVRIDREVIERLAG